MTSQLTYIRRRQVFDPHDRKVFLLTFTIHLSTLQRPQKSGYAEGQELCLGPPKYLKRLWSCSILVTHMGCFWDRLVATNSLRSPALNEYTVFCRAILLAFSSCLINNLNKFVPIVLGLLRTIRFIDLLGIS